MKRRAFLTGAAGCLAAPVAWAGGINDPRQNRSLILYNPNTSERFVGAYWRRGWFDPGALRELSYFMRDWRRDAVKEFDPFAIDRLYQICKRCDYDGEVVVLSGYRTPETNEFLKMNSRYAPAENSLHLEAKAIDFTIPSLKISDLFAAAREDRDGGLGYYPDNHFLHIDTGVARIWRG